MVLVGDAGLTVVGVLGAVVAAGVATTAAVVVAGAVVAAGEVVVVTARVEEASRRLRMTKHTGLGIL